MKPNTKLIISVHGEHFFQPAYDAAMQACILDYDDIGADRRLELSHETFSLKDLQSSSSLTNFHLAELLTDSYICLIWRGRECRIQLDSEVSFE